MKINVRVHEHILCPLFKKNLQAVHFEGHITPLGRFGYVHSQRRASASWNEKNPDAVSGFPLCLNNFLELAYCAVGQIYHASSLPYIMCLK
jgi:hypothetical protein